jgi:hypothetical protein
MQRRKSIPKHEDEVQAARRVFDTVIASTETTEIVSQSMISLVMSQMGKKGGSKGGKMRLVTMTPERRSEVASIAAKKRWAKKTKKK